MINYIRRVAEWGINPDTPSNQAHHIRLTNVLLLFMFFASIFETIVCFATGAIEAGMLNSTAPFVFGAGLWLMKLGHTQAARFMVITISYIGGYGLVSSLGPESYFQFIFLFASAFSLAFFSVNERFYLICTIIMPLVGFIALEMTNYAPVFGMTRAQLSHEQLLIMRTLSLTIIWALMVFHFYYFTRDRKKTQEQLISAAKMVAMGRMAAGIAHEVNNPLQLIVSHAERLKMLSKNSGAAENQYVQVANQIQNVAMRIASINKGLLALSRDATSDPLLTVSVNTILRLSLDFCKAHLESNNIELRMNPVPEDLNVIGRETQLSEVILNILNNAAYAVLQADEKWIQIETKAEKEWVEIAITDSGPGVPHSVLHRIFDPFFTTKPVGKGTGLGLSVSQSLMEAQGGQISYDPKSSSAGARFIVKIPRAVSV